VRVLIEQLETGIETIDAERLTVVEVRVLHTDAKTGAETRFVRIDRLVRNRPLMLDEAHRLHAHHGPRAPDQCVLQAAGADDRRPSLLLDDGTVTRRIRLIRPLGSEMMKRDDFDARAGSRRPWSTCCTLGRGRRTRSRHLPPISCC
jgi:hypothetical protein